MPVLSPSGRVVVDDAERCQPDKALDMFEVAAPVLDPLDVQMLMQADLDLIARPRTADQLRRDLSVLRALDAGHHIRDPGHYQGCHVCRHIQWYPPRANCERLP